MTRAHTLLPIPILILIFITLNPIQQFPNKRIPQPLQTPLKLHIILRIPPHPIRPRNRTDPLKRKIKHIRRIPAIGPTNPVPKTRRRKRKTRLPHKRDPIVAVDVAPDPVDELAVAEDGDDRERGYVRGARVEGAVPGPVPDVAEHDVRVDVGV
jgi:hypothetical protein